MLSRPAYDKNDMRRAIQAAGGWLSLGLASAALDELASLDPVYQSDPAVLHEQARILVALGRLNEAKATIYRLARIAPEIRLALLDDPALEAVWM